VALMAALALAGCAADDAGGPSPGQVVDEDSFRLAAGKGAIAGLLVDDRFRPIHLTAEDATTEFQARGFVLLQETGAQTQTTPNGEFSFVDLDPGTYTLRVTASGHEAVPQKVSVQAGSFAETSVVARRVSSAGATIITEEYSVFIPCGYDYVANGGVIDCTFDQSGDSYRPGFVSDYTRFGTNATNLVSEMRANHVDRYEMQVREADGTSGGGQRLAVAQFEGDYVKLLWRFGETNEEWNGQNNNGPWTNAFPIHTILFRDSPGREEVQALGLPFCCGAGVYFGIKAQFLQSLFLGTPDVSVESYCVLCTS
jgi:hypothetical protein